MSEMLISIYLRGVEPSVLGSEPHKMMDVQQSEHSALLTAR